MTCCKPFTISIGASLCPTLPDTFVYPTNAGSNYNVPIFRYSNGKMLSVHLEVESGGSGNCIAHLYRHSVSSSGLALDGSATVADWQPDEEYITNGAVVNTDKMIVPGFFDDGITAEPRIYALNFSTATPAVDGFTTYDAILSGIPYTGSYQNFGFKASLVSGHVYWLVKTGSPVGTARLLRIAYAATPTYVAQYSSGVSGFTSAIDVADSTDKTWFVYFNGSNTRIAILDRATLAHISTFTLDNTERVFYCSAADQMCALLSTGELRFYSTTGTYDSSVTLTGTYDYEFGNYDADGKIAVIMDDGGLVLNLVDTNSKSVACQYPYPGGVSFYGGMISYLPEATWWAKAQFTSWTVADTLQIAKQA